ncbi:MAG: TlpA family protein disulfide reductase [Verrucomicrobia bacterium]|nr:MAG: TlpA family protein disulfide reductase [Verrucomicrobiota bacterium]
MNMFRPSSLAAALAAALLSLPSVFAGSVRIGDAFPDLAGAGFEGRLPDLAGKIVIVDFWASWCVPCKKALPMYAGLQKEYGDRGVVVVAISLDEEKDKMEAFLKKIPLPFSTVRDAKGQFAEKVGVTGIPTSYVLTPDGKVHALHREFEGEKTRRKLTVELDAILKSK